RPSHPALQNPLQPIDKTCHALGRHYELRMLYAADHADHWREANSKTGRTGNEFAQMHRRFDLGVSEEEHIVIAAAGLLVGHGLHSKAHERRIDKGFAASVAGLIMGQTC